MSSSDMSISQKMTLAIVGVSSFFAVLTMLVQLIWNYQAGLNDAKNDVEEYTLSILPSIARSLWEVDRHLLNDLIAGIGMLPLVSGVSLNSVDGVDLALGMPSKAFDFTQEVLVYPLDIEQRQIGQLTITIDKDELFYHLWQQIIFIILGNGLKTLLMIYVILTLMRLMVGRRLEVLENFANQISVTSFKKIALSHVVTRDNDEIGRVGEALLAMHSRIRDGMALTQRQQRRLTQQQAELSDLVGLQNQEIDWQIQSNQLLAEISLGLLNSHSLHVSENLEAICAKIGALFDVERVSIIDCNTAPPSYRCFWSSMSLAGPVASMSEINLNQFINAFKAQSLLVLRDVDVIAEKAPLTYQAIRSVGICSVSAFVLSEGEQALGLLVLANVTKPFEWPDQKTAMLTQFAAALNEFWIREQKELQMLQLQQALMTANAQLQVMAHTDALTGLANRRPFEAALSKSLDSDCDFGLLMIDVDFFKLFNDTYGHVEGDFVLKQVASGLTNLQGLPEGSILARIGGEEFAIVIPKAEAAQLTVIAEGICQLVANLRIPHRSSSFGIITVSVGALLVPATANMTPKDVLSETDGRLYRAKSSGRNQAVTLES